MIILYDKPSSSVSDTTSSDGSPTYTTFASVNLWDQVDSLIMSLMLSSIEFDTSLIREGYLGTSTVHLH